MTELPKQYDFRKFYVVTLYVATVAWGIVQVFSQHGGIQYIISLIFGLTATLWTVSDARQRGRPILHIVQFFILVSWPIAVPIYLIWSRGKRGVGLLLLHGVGLSIASYASFYGTVFSVYGFDVYAAQPADIYFEQGISCYERGELDKAIENYSEAIRLAPENADAFNNRGVAWDDKGEYDKAIADYSEAIRLDPKGADAYNNRGIAWKNIGDGDKANADFAEAKRLRTKK